MSLEPEHLELPLQESSINPSLELAQKLLQNACVNDMSENCDKMLEVMSQDVCNKPMLDIGPEAVYDSVKKLLQVQENGMSCEHTKEHVKHPEEHVENQELLQKPLQDPYEIHMEGLPNEVLHELLPCSEEIARSNVPLPSSNNSLQMSSQPLLSTRICQDLLEEPEVQMSVVSALEKECNVSDTRSITDCQPKDIQHDGNCKHHMTSMTEDYRHNNLKRIQERQQCGKSQYHYSSKYKCRSLSHCQSCNSEISLQCQCFYVGIS